MEPNYDTETTEFQESEFHDFDDYGIDFSEEPDLRSYQLAYCSENFDISSCDRYAHFNRPFFKTILILRKFNIDILDIFVIALIFNVVFTKHLCDILEKPLQSVIRYYNINFQPYVHQIKIEAKTKKISLQERVSKYRLEKSQLSVKTSEQLVVHTREPSLSGGASLCESDKQTSLTAETPDSLPSSDETIRNIEKWAFNFTKFALSGPNKNRHKIIVSDWLNALNEQTKKLSSSSSRSGYKITFDNISEKSRTPKITKLRAEITPTGSTCVVAHLESKKLILELKFEPNSTFKPSELQTKSIVVEKLVGELILTPSRDGFGHYKMCASFMGRPQVAKVSYYQEADTTNGANGSNNNNNEIINNQELTLLVYQCIAGMTVDINLSSCNSVPESIIAGTPNQSVASKIEEMVETVRKETAGSVNKSTGGSGSAVGDGSGNKDSGSPKEGGGVVVPIPPARIRSADRRLLVKVIKASITSNASAESGVFNPYCVLESDFPSQKHRTNTIHSTNEPFWDEHFLFDVTRRTKTLTVTVYDRDQTQDKNILGQCQIDLMENRRINLSWQTFKLENPYSPGTLQYATITLELMFVGQSNSSDKSSTLNNLTSNAVSPANRNSLQISLQELESIESSQQSPRTNNSVTFNMVPAPDPPNPGRRSPFNSVKRGRSRNKSASPKRSERSRSRTSEGGGPAKAIKDWFSRRDRSVDITQRGMEQSHQLQQQQQNQPLIVRLRSKEQLNSSGAQSPGVGLGAGGVGGGVGGSAGLGGSTEGPIAPRVTSPPPVLQPTSPAVANSDTSSINSRNSFVNYDCSTLVIESTVEGKFYLISKELAKSGKHGLKGNKLHIYNDHTFVATHFTRSETCEVCLKPISKRLGLGKQGYRCRDCEYTCHKGCHYKTELICANSRVSSMEMEFVGEAQLVFQETPNQDGTGSGNNSLTRNKGGGGSGGSTNGSPPPSQTLL